MRGEINIFSRSCSYKVQNCDPAPIKHQLVNLSYPVITITYGGNIIIEARTLWDIAMCDVVNPAVSRESTSIIDYMFDDGYSACIGMYKGHRLDIYYPSPGNPTEMIVWDNDALQVIGIAIDNSISQLNVKITDNFYEIFDENAMYKIIRAFKEREVLPNE